MNRNWTATWDDPASGAQSARELTGVEYLPAIMRGDAPPPPFANLMGFAVESVDEGRVTFALDPAERHYNPFGVLHGGVAASLFDSALGCAVQSQLPPARIAPTMELHVNYIRPITITTGRVRCTGEVIHLGTRSAIAQGRLVDMQGKLYAHATGTFVISELPDLPTR
jgi:uncharacterized protein (TIGR00369 family)